MIEKLSTALRKYANGWLVLLLLAGEVFFNAVILPAQQANIERVSGGTGPIDLLFFYTPEKVYGMIASYGDEARASYRLFELTGDILYPIVYTLFFSLALTWLFQRGFASTSPMQKYNVVPFGGWFFDLLENLGIVAMLSIFPSTPGALAWITAVFTLMKWLFAISTGVLLLIGLGLGVKNGFKKQS